MSETENKPESTGPTPLFARVDEATAEVMREIERSLTKDFIDQLAEHGENIDRLRENVESISETLDNHDTQSKKLKEAVSSLPSQLSEMIAECFDKSALPKLPELVAALGDDLKEQFEKNESKLVEMRTSIEQMKNRLDSNDATLMKLQDILAVMENAARERSEKSDEKLAEISKHIEKTQATLDAHDAVFAALGQDSKGVSLKVESLRNDIGALNFEALHSAMTLMSERLAAIEEAQRDNSKTLEYLSKPAWSRMFGGRKND